MSCSMPRIFADVTADAAVTKERNGGDTFDADAELTLPRVDVKGTDFYTRAAGNGIELMLRQFRNFYCLS